MLKTIRRRLILLYTCSTGFILTFIMIILWIVSDRQLAESKEQIFQNHFDNLIKTIQFSNQIKHEDLSELESKNNLVIQIEDNGVPIRYKGAWKAKTDRSHLIEELKQLAITDTIDISIRPISRKELKSGIYKVKGQDNDYYLGAVFAYSFENGYRGLAILQYDSSSIKFITKQKVIFILVDLLGILALYIISTWFVSKTLKPVEESRKRQTEFIASASHELKSPLAVIRANISAFKVEPEKREYFIKGMEQECGRMSKLIEDMLLLASIDAKSWGVKKEIVDMDLLLIDIYEVLYPYCREKGKDFELELREDILPKVKGDSERIKQIIMILVDNASSYTKEKDCIILRGIREKNHLRIQVEDHGTGIPDDRKKEVFERFYQVEQSRKDKSHFGLGLNIASELAGLLDGILTLKDTAGGGCTFTLSLPIYEE